MKRFTECGKWRDKWFYALSTKHKLLWVWLCDNCDNAGLVEPCWDIIKSEVGSGCSDEDLKVFSDRLQDMGRGKYLLVKFITFQYGKLSQESKPHLAIRALIARQGMEFDDDSQRVFYRVSDTLTDRVCNTLQEKEKETDKEKDQGKERVQREKGRATSEEISAYCAELGFPASDGPILFDKWQGAGWKNGGNKIADWKATVRAWGKQGYLPHQQAASAQGQLPNTEDGIYRSVPRRDAEGNIIPGQFT